MTISITTLSIKHSECRILCIVMPNVIMLNAVAPKTLTDRHILRNLVDLHRQRDRHREGGKEGV